MTFGVLKEKVHQLEDFLAQLLKTNNEALEKINSGNYKAVDIFDYECMSYNISGIFYMLNLFRLDYKIELVANKLIVRIKAREKELNYKELQFCTNISLGTMKTIQLDSISKNTQEVFDNPCLNETVEFMYLYYFYGMKIVCSFFDINLDGKANREKELTLGQSNIIQKEMTEFRRTIARLAIYAKNRIEAYEKIKITNLRLQVLEARNKRFELENLLADGMNNKSIVNDEKSYNNSRINFHNTELIKFRSDLSENEELLNRELKTLYKEYFGLE